MTLNAIFFDLDDTLIYEDATDAAVMVDVVTSELPEVQISSTELVAAVHGAARTLWRQSPAAEYCRTIGTSSIEGLYGDYSGSDPHLGEVRRYLTEGRYRERVWAAALETLEIGDHPDLASSLARAYAKERGGRHVLMPDAAALIQYLTGITRLVLLTNGAPAIQRAKLRGSGLASQFEIVVISGDLGVGKPDPAIFDYTLTYVDVEADEVVMVGDSLTHDVRGAQAAGIRAIWFNPAGLPDSAEIQPWRTVTRLADTLAVFEW